DRLLLQQLRLREWASERADDAGASSDDSPVRDDRASLTKDWSFVDGIELHPWQRSASDAWFEAGRRGTIKVVTGAGKTIAALAIADRLHREDPELRVAVVVPTIVLMQQWYDVLTKRADVPAPLVGLLGGGHKDDFAGQRRVVVAVLASARKELPG